MKRSSSFLLIFRLLLSAVFISIISVLFFLEPIKQGVSSLRNSFSSVDTVEKDDTPLLTGEGLNSEGADTLRHASKGKLNQMQRTASGKTDWTAKFGRTESGKPKMTDWETKFRKAEAEVSKSGDGKPDFSPDSDGKPDFSPDSDGKPDFSPDSDGKPDFEPDY